MICAWLAGVALLQPVEPTLAAERPARVVLSRGQARYHSVEDTFLDQDAPDSNFGRDPLITLGAGKVGLIRFVRLEQFARPGLRVHDAELRLPIVSAPAGVTADAFQVGLVRAGWGEGPARRGLDRPRLRPGERVVAPIWAATWNQRRGGPEGVSWARPGAGSTEDALPLAEAVVALEDEMLVIRGIDDVVQAMADRPWENHGFSLTSATPLELASSDHWRVRPSLSFQVEPRPPTDDPDLAVVSLDRGEDTAGRMRWVATVRNLGQQTAQGFTIRWTYRDRPAGSLRFEQTLEPGAEEKLEVDLPLPTPSADHRVHPVQVSVEPTGPDARPSNNGRKAFATAWTIRLRLPESPAGQRVLAEGLQQWESAVNELLFAQSRSSVAPEGCLERVRFVLDGTANAEWALTPEEFGRLTSEQDPPFDRVVQHFGMPSFAWNEPVAGVPVRSFDSTGGLLGWGDTRDDTQWPAAIVLTDPQWFNPLELTSPMRAHGLLSRSAVLWLHAAMGRPLADRATVELPTAPTVIVRLLDAQGRQRPGLSVRVRQTTADGLVEVFQGTTGSTGSVILPSREGTGPFGRLAPDFSNGRLLFEVDTPAGPEHAWLPAWRLWDDFARGSRAAAVLELRFAMTDAPLDRTQNLALNRIVTDTENSFPAQLQALVDGVPDTSVTFRLAQGGHVEIDLGRDRTIGEVVLEPGESLWHAFDIRGYNTGQKPSDARVLFREVSSSASRAQRAAPDGSIAYRFPATRVRFLLLAPTLPSPSVLRGIRVHPSVETSP